jgi:hypothetical protein
VDTDDRREFDEIIDPTFELEPARRRLGWDVW